MLHNEALTQVQKVEEIWRCCCFSFLVDSRLDSDWGKQKTSWCWHMSKYGVHITSPKFSLILSFWILSCVIWQLVFHNLFAYTTLGLLFRCIFQKTLFRLSCQVFSLIQHCTYYNCVEILTLIFLFLQVQFL